MDNWGTSIYEYCREVWDETRSVAKRIVNKIFRFFFQLICNERISLNRDNLETSARDQ